MEAIEKCKWCGKSEYQISKAYDGRQQVLLAVECVDCRLDIIPVVVARYAPRSEMYKDCETVWNLANKTQEEP